MPKTKNHPHTMLHRGIVYLSTATVVLLQMAALCLPALASSAQSTPPVADHKTAGPTPGPSSKTPAKKSAPGAQRTHAITTRGKPALPQGFTAYPYANPNAPKGGALRMISQGSFDCLNRTFKCTSPDGLELTQDTLMSRNREEPFTLYGLVAESVRLSEDHKSIEFFLNPKAAWHDGTPITVEDVIFSFETIRDKGMPYYRSNYKNVQSVEKTGDRAVKFTLKPDVEDREIPFVIALLPVLNKAYFTAQDLQYDDPIHKPILTSGPYTIHKVELGRYITYKRNPSYWGKDLPVNRGRHNFDTIRYDYYRDLKTALQAFKAGTHDVFRESSQQSFEKNHQGPNYKNGKIIKRENPNTNPVGLRGISLNTRLPLFADKRVRQALILGFDRNYLSKTILPGMGHNNSYFDNTDMAAPQEPTPAETALLKSLDPSLDPRKLTHIARKAEGQSHRKNLKEALSMLKEAGWHLQNGILKNVAGTAFVFDLIVTNPDEQKIALAFARNMKELGIQVNVKMVDAAQYELRKQDRSFDAIMTWWATSNSPGNELAFYWSCAARDNTGSRNYPGICNATVDKLLSRVPLTRSREDLITTTHAIDRLLMDEAWLVPLFYPAKIYMAVSRSINTDHATTNPLDDYHFWYQNKEK